MTPFEAASKAAIGGNIRTFLLQRHLILDHLIDQVIQDQGITQVLEIACGAEGSRWFGLSRLAAEFDGGFVHLACQILGVAGVREGFPKPAPCGTSLWRLSSAIHGSAQFWKGLSTWLAAHWVRGPESLTFQRNIDVPTFALWSGPVSRSFIACRPCGPATTA